MAVELVLLDTFSEWFGSLPDKKDQEKALKILGVLEQMGKTCPYSRQLEQSNNLFRLKVQSRGIPYRIIFAYHPTDDGEAIIIIGGNKKGKKDDRWYRQMIRKSEQILNDYLDD